MGQSLLSPLLPSPGRSQVCARAGFSQRGSASEQGGGEGALLGRPCTLTPNAGPQLSPSQEAPQISVAMMSS